MRKSCFLMIAPLAIFTAAIVTFAQSPSLSSDYVLEVKVCECMPLSYQQLTTWRWFGAFKRVDGWKPKPGELPIHAVKIFALQRPGPVTVRVKLMRGEHLEVEEVVGDYPVTENVTVAAELKNFGIMQFEMRLVRAPLTVSELPAIKNMTRSLVVSVEPTTAVLPSFNARFWNSPERPVISIAITESVNGRENFNLMPHDLDGGVLIEPGAIYQKVLPYPTKPVLESTGGTPDAKSGLQLNILAVIFSDGSYEGDPSEAMRLRAFKVGEKIQLTRVLALLRSPAAESPELLGPAADALSSKVLVADIAELTAQFPNRQAGEIENARVAADVAAADIQHEFRKAFGRSSDIPPDKFAGAVKAAIVRYQSMLDAMR
jgi:hypothetical protein